MLHNKRHKPPLHSKPTGRRRRSKRVTLIAAFRTSEGVVICAETLGNPTPQGYENYRCSVNKLQPQTDGAYQWVCGGSGDGDLVDDFVDRLKDEIGFKIYSTVSGRRFMSDLREAKARGYLSQAPHYNSVFRYLEAEALTPYLYSLINTSSLPLKSVESDFAVDSSGFSTGQFMRWLDVKYGKEEDRRMWLKVHLICGVKTNIVTAVQVSDGYAHDYPFFKGLVDSTANAGFKMKEVSADKGYLGASNMLATLQRGAIPYIPFKTNSVAQSDYDPKSQLWSRMFQFYDQHREEFLMHYHKRSNVETTFHMIKRSLVKDFAVRL